jgi:phosphoribosylformylglycinamidine synthase
MVGVLDNASEMLMTLDFKTQGDKIFLLGKVVEDFGASEYLYSYRKVKYSPAPYLNLQEEKALQHALLTLISKKAIQSAHDLSDGGLAVALCESGFPRGFGFDIQTPAAIRTDAFLYGEAGGRAIVSVSAAQLSAFQSTIAELGIPSLELGSVNGQSVIINGEIFGSLADFNAAFEGGLTQWVG